MKVIIIIFLITFCVSLKTQKNDNNNFTNAIKNLVEAAKIIQTNSQKYNQGIGVHGKNTILDFYTNLAELYEANEEFNEEKDGIFLKAFNELADKNYELLVDVESTFIEIKEKFIISEANKEYEQMINAANDKYKTDVAWIDNVNSKNKGANGLTQKFINKYYINAGEAKQDEIKKAHKLIENTKNKIIDMTYYWIDFFSLQRREINIQQKTNLEAFLLKKDNKLGKILFNDGSKKVSTNCLSVLNSFGNIFKSQGKLKRAVNMLLNKQAKEKNKMQSLLACIYKYAQSKYIKSKDECTYLKMSVTSISTEYKNLLNHYTEAKIKSGELNEEEKSIFKEVVQTRINDRLYSIKNIYCKYFK